jgi:Capsule polysaccharide biosynthesis protein
MKVLIAGNQGGAQVVALHGAVGKALMDRLPATKLDFMVWLKAEAEDTRKLAPLARQIHAYESYLDEGRDGWPAHLDRIVRGYPEVNWSAVVASERSFTDSSFLLGGAGHRHEGRAYVERLVVNTVRFMETVFEGSDYDAVICQTADSFFTHVLFKIARHFGVKIFAITPAWLQEGGKPGCFFTNDEYLRCDRMVEAYRSLLPRPLTATEVERSDSFRQAVLGFDGNKAFYSVRKTNFGRNPLSPNVWRLPSYLADNLRKDKYLHYTRIDPVAKARANMLRLWRKWRSRSLVGTPDVVVPKKSVFFALHFQPEQSTLVGGIYYANQIALVENIVKSLPLDYTLVLKEHPAGRGARPAWQYRHLASFPNVMFCDAPSKAIAAKVDAVVTITGTVGVESIALDKATIMFGRSFFDYCDLLYRVTDATELPQIFHRILIDREYERRNDRIDHIRKFLLSYLVALTPHYPTPDSAAQIAEALVGDFVSANLLSDAA